MWNDLVRLKITQLSFTEIAQKNLGGTNYISGYAEIPKTQKQKQKLRTTFLSSKILKGYLDSYKWKQTL